MIWKLIVRSGIRKDGPFYYTSNILKAKTNSFIIFKEKLIVQSLFVCWHVVCKVGIVLLF